MYKISSFKNKLQHEYEILFKTSTKYFTTFSTFILHTKTENGFPLLTHQKLPKKWTCWQFPFLNSFKVISLWLYPETSVTTVSKLWTWSNRIFCSTCYQTQFLLWQKLVWKNVQNEQQNELFASMTPYRWQWKDRTLISLFSFVFGNTFGHVPLVPTPHIYITLLQYVPSDHKMEQKKKQKKHGQPQFYLNLCPLRWNSSIHHTCLWDTIIVSEWTFTHLIQVLESC